MDFYKIVEIDPAEEGYTINPYAGTIRGEYVSGYTSIDYLNKTFGEYEKVEEMKEVTEIEGFKLYLDWLKEQGILN